MIKYVELDQHPLCGGKESAVLYNLETPVVRCADCMRLDFPPLSPRFLRKQFGLDDVRIGLIEDADFAGAFDVISCH